MKVTDEHREIAKKTMSKHYTATNSIWAGFPNNLPEDIEERIESSVAKALAEHEGRVIERCAEVATSMKDYRQSNSADFVHGYRWSSDDIVKAIRQLGEEKDV